MNEYDITLFDVKGFTTYSSQRQIEIKHSLQKTIKDYFDEINLPYSSTATGDGYYISLNAMKNNHVVLLDLISYLISELDDIELRFALHCGMLEDYTELDNSKGLIGAAFSDLNRILAGIKIANVIFCSRAFYEKFINGVQTVAKSIDADRMIITYKKLHISDKHNKQHEIYNIGYRKDLIDYGFASTDLEPGIGKDDILEFDDFKKIIENSFGQKKSTILKKVEQNKPSIHYCYLVIDISQYTKEYFLFIKNKSVKIQVIEHFINNNKIHEPLTICANNKYLDEKWDEFWKNDLIQKFQKKVPLIRRFSFKYIKDFLWENCIPESLKTLALFEEESNFINPEYSVESVTLNKKPKVEEYLTEFIRNDSTPIALLKGSGGMGKTTLLKRVSDLLQKKSNNKKTVFFVDGQNIAKYLNKHEEANLEKIDSMSSLLRFYFSTLSSTGVKVNSEAPILLNNELIDIIISSGNIVIMIDGLDEISGYLKESFSLQRFINDIVKINNILNHGKILISTRDFYWNYEISKIDDVLIDNFRVINLNGFNETMAVEYFEKKFKDTPDDNAKALQILKSLNRNRSAIDYYWPFLVYLVSDIVLKEKSSNFIFNHESIEIHSKYLDSTIEFDNIIINFCLRENQRQNLDLSINNFLELFKEIVIDYQGEMKMSDFKDYVSLILSSLSKSGNNFEGYKMLLINPLLKVRNEKVIMSIDFIQFHLTSAFLAYFICDNIHSNNIYKILSRYYDGKEDILKEIVLRLKRKNIEITKLSTYINKLIIGFKNDLSQSEQLINQRAISTLLYISFRVFDSRVSISATERTALLIELFNDNLENVHIFGDFYTLDFASLTFKDSTFRYYSNFLKSNMDENTLFIDCKFEILHVFGIKTNAWSPKNFDQSCHMNGDFKLMLENTNSNKLADVYAIKKDIILLLKRFQKAGRFVFQSESHLEFPTNSKIAFPDLLRKLLNLHVLNNKGAKEPYNWSVMDGYRDSVTQLLQNNHIDINFDKVLFILYDEFYKSKN